MMFGFTFTTVTLLLSSTVLAVPSQRSTGFPNKCDISTAKPTLPLNQTALVAPSTAPSFIGLAIGNQNYTCGSTGTYTSVGAVAELFDISCLYGSPEFEKLQDIAYTMWKFAPPAAPISVIIEYMASFHASFVLGQHYFIPAASGTGVSPKWDFSSAALEGHPDAFVVAAKAGGLPAPTGPKDVDWLALNGVQGKLATQVFRLNTAGGVPPASCNPGSSPISVKYASTYWLYGSSV
ncbi:hypothetical protein C8J57DRAFT_677209 [Mycena rebaudengoi]|nr:hypothetical protein C8J57DRAFT_677209 [Mycena rebaudengoi]